MISIEKNKKPRWSKNTKCTKEKKKLKKRQTKNNNWPNKNKQKIAVKILQNYINILIHNNILLDITSSCFSSYVVFMINRTQYAAHYQKKQLVL